MISLNNCVNEVGMSSLVELIFVIGGDGISSSVEKNIVIFYNNFFHW